MNLRFPLNPKSSASRKAVFHTYPYPLFVLFFAGSFSFFIKSGELNYDPYWNYFLRFPKSLLSSLVLLFPSPESLCCQWAVWTAPSNYSFKGMDTLYCYSSALVFVGRWKGWESVIYCKLGIFFVFLQGVTCIFVVTNVVSTIQTKHLTEKIQVLLAFLSRNS